MRRHFNVSRPYKVEGHLVALRKPLSYVLRARIRLHIRNIGFQFDPEAGAGLDHLC